MYSSRLSYIFFTQPLCQPSEIGLIISLLFYRNQNRSSERLTGLQKVTKQAKFRALVQINFLQLWDFIL